MFWLADEATTGFGVMLEIEGAEGAGGATTLNSDGPDDVLSEFRTSADQVAGVVVKLAEIVALVGLKELGTLS